MQDNTVVITGAGGGIGNALCIAFSQKGWKVIATDYLDKCNSECHSYIQLDLKQLCRDTNYADEKINELLSYIDGRLNALVNNAALQILKPIEDLNQCDWHDTIDVNLIAPAIFARKLLVPLENGHGSIINISSIHAKLTKSNFTAYATSKAGLNGLTRALAVELGGRVRVNAISPAAISTSMLEEGFANNTEGFAALKKFHPSQVIGQPDEVARAALYLADMNSPFLTGSILALDGGIASRLHDPD